MSNGALSAEELIAKGICPIKREFITRPESRKQVEAVGSAAVNEGNGQKPAQELHKKSRNQKRREGKQASSTTLCPNLARPGGCSYGDKCRKSHDVETYMKSRPPDLPGRCPFSQQPGQCPYGILCRWAGTHTVLDDLTKRLIDEGVAKVQSDKVSFVELPVPDSVQKPINELTNDVQTSLRKNLYRFHRADAITCKLGAAVTLPTKYKKAQPPPAASAEAAVASKPVTSSGPQNLTAPTDAVARGPEGVPPASGTLAAAPSTEATPSAAADALDSDTKIQQADATSQRHDGAPEAAAPMEAAVDTQQARPQANGTADARAAAGNSAGAAEAAAPAPGEMSAERGDNNSSIAADSQPALKRLKPDSGAADDGGATHNSSGPAVPIYDVSKASGSDRATLGAAEPRAKPRLDLRGKLYCAPLTTTGNLPFRRIVKGFKCDVTCGEMAMASNLLQGQQSEWALLKRHPCEDLFGVQILAGHADSAARCVQLLDEHIDTDFIDINMGCPIDLVCNKGAGSGLLLKPKRMEQIVRAAATTATRCAVTFKTRMAYHDRDRVAHNILPHGADWGAVAVTLHGRTRQQRYSRAADWDYLEQVAASVPSSLQMIGNGDVYSFEDYNEHMKCGKFATCMIARGALIKPWIFTEIKEQRHWDISASERLDMLKNYCKFGLEHWGSDARGVETTRRFLLEWLSFLHRYVPVGLLEVVPSKMTWRPPPFVGRSDLETLLSSSSASDWVKISEMLLGPAPDNFTFAPKHRSNAWVTSDADVEGAFQDQG